MLGLSGNSSNVAVRIAKIMAYAVAGTAGTYPPTFLQVNFHNDVFMQSYSSSATPRDSLLDAGGQGAGPPAVALYIPESQRLVNSGWTTATTTVVAEADSLPSGARIMWYVTVDFKF